MIRVVAGFFVLMVMISAGTVYSLKEATERLDARKRQLSASILKDRAAIKVLRAEMAYLSQPERLEKLSNRFLALSPSRSYQMAESVNTIAGREGHIQVSLPVDEFPVLLPQEKPIFQKKKYNRQVVLAFYPAEKTPAPKKTAVKKTAVNKATVKDTKTRKANFYDRISLRLKEEE